MSVTAKPDEQETPVQPPAPDDQVADLRRRIKAMEVKLAAETAALEEQKKLAHSMARAARAEAADGEALAKELAELRSLLKKQQDDHIAATRAAEAKREAAQENEESVQEDLNAEVEARIARELEQRLADARMALDEERERERAKLAEAAESDAEQRLADAEAAWRKAHENELADAAAALQDEEAQRLAAARTEWEREHDAAIAELDRNWRERLAREIKEAREAMEKAWARAEEGPGATVAPNLRSMREKLNAAAYRRRLLIYRTAVAVLVLVIVGAFVFREPLFLREGLIAAGNQETALPDRATSAEREPAPIQTEEIIPNAAVEPPDPPRDTPKPTTAESPAEALPTSTARTKALETELSTLRERLEAEEKRANAADYKAAKANAARKRVAAEAVRSSRAQKNAQTKAITDLKAEVNALRERLEAAIAATVSGQAPE
jgi:hypothetical protein